MDPGEAVQGDLDESDIEILEHVERKRNEDVDELAEQLDPSRPTIYYRIDKLKEQGGRLGSHRRCRSASTGVGTVRHH